MALLPIITAPDPGSKSRPGRAAVDAKVRGDDDMLETMYQAIVSAGATAGRAVDRRHRSRCRA